MNEENAWDNRVEASVTEGLVEAITLEEVVKATKAMKLGKAAGKTEVAVEHILASGDIGTKVIADIANGLLEGRGIPEDWKHSLLVLLYKGKDDVRDCGAYRGVKLLEHDMKIVKRIFEAWLRNLRNMVTVNDMQCGFMPEKGTIDALYMVRMSQEEYLRKKKKLYMCFVDLEKAFNIVPRQFIYWAP